MASGRIFSAVVAFFEEDHWNFHWLEDVPVLSVPFTGRSGRWMCYAQAREEQEQFVFYSVCPVNAPPERRPAVAEFITRANYGMIIGNFEMDYDDGEVRYKTSIDVEGDDLSNALIKQMVYANVIIMDRYLAGIMAVIYGQTDPVTEIEKIEGEHKNAAGGKLEEAEDALLDNLSESVRSHIENILRDIEENHEDNDGNGSSNGHDYEENFGENPFAEDNFLEDAPDNNPQDKPRDTDKGDKSEPPKPTDTGDIPA